MFDDESVVSFQDAVDRYNIEDVSEQIEDLGILNEGDEEDYTDAVPSSAVEDVPVTKDLDHDSSLQQEDEEGEIDQEKEEDDQGEEEEEEPQPVSLATQKPERLFEKRNSKASSKNDETSSVATSTAKGKKKNINKKKARRYAEQDEEDRELAMMILGHTSSKGEKITDKKTKKEQEKKNEDIRSRQAKAGVNLLQSDWKQLMDLQHPEIVAELNKVIAEGFMMEGDIDEQEMRKLAAVPSDQGLEILNLFRDSKQVSKIVNKSGFIAGIIRRVVRDHETGNRVVGTKPSAATSTKQHEKATNEENEIKELMQEEGILDEEEGKNSDDIDKLYPNPAAEDRILYAVPVCAPYLAMKNFKFKVKLTPGTAKKGKASKQVMDLFIRSKEATEIEKNMMKNLGDNELNSVMIGDVKISMPGLYQQLKSNKKQKGQKDREK